MNYDLEKRLKKKQSYEDATQEIKKIMNIPIKNNTLNNNRVNIIPIAKRQSMLGISEKNLNLKNIPIKKQEETNNFDSIMNNKSLLQKNNFDINKARIPSLNMNNTDLLKAIKKYDETQKLDESTIGKGIIGASKLSYEGSEALKNVLDGAKRGGTEFLNYIVSNEIQRDKELSDAMIKAFQENNIPVNENSYAWQISQNDEARNTFLNSIEDKVSKYDKEIQERTESIDNPIIKKASELAPSIGNMIPGTVLSAVQPVAGATYFMGSAGGSYLSDARKKGANEEDALKYATVLGVAEGATEMIGVGQLLKGGKALGKGAIKEAIKSYGFNMADNFIQEAIMEPIQESASELILKESDWNNIGQRMISSGIDGALTALIMDGANSGIVSSINVLNKAKNNSPITNLDIEKAKRDINAVTNKIAELEIMKEDKANKIPISSELIKKYDKKTVSERLQLPMTNSLEVSTQLPTTNVPQKENYASTVQNNTKIPINKELVKKDDMLYNNIKSDGDVNGRKATGNQNEQDLSEFDTGGRRLLQQSTVSNEVKSRNEEVRQRNKEIVDFVRSNEVKDVSPEVNRIKNDIKVQRDVNLVVFDSKDTGFGGGVIDKNTIGIDKTSLEEYGVKFLVGHEEIERLIKYSPKSDEIIKLADKVYNSPNFNKAYEEYLSVIDERNIEFYKNYPHLIAKEIICDEMGFLLHDNDKIIKNYLDVINDVQLKQEIDNVLLNIYKATYNSSLNETNTMRKNVAPTEQINTKSNRTLTPLEISNISKNDVTTTPILPKINNNIDKNHQSKFYSNLESKTNMLNDNLKNIIKSEDDIRYYEGVTNEQALLEAYDKLQNGGSKETLRWLSKDLNKKDAQVSATEVAEGWILLKQFQDTGDYQSAVNIAKKMRDMATKTGQALQAFNIQARLTPEGMIQYAQSELSEAFERFSKNKTKDWIQENSKKFDLSSKEADAIVNKVKEAQELPENSYEKKAKLAEIQKIMTDKLPPERGEGIKAWMRISMLFNPKTQVRNVLGNTVIVPVNMASDFVSSIADSFIAKKTGIRTIGNTNIVNYAKGFKKGMYESYNDFKNDINTRDINGNRFEIGKGKSFENKGLGKTLNRIDDLLSFMLDAGDRPFYEATFTNSINNQLKLNNTDIVTKDMIDIATNEALSRTWQDNNAYTNAVLNIRKSLNKFNINGYGLGDVFIPFAKTPANLTKAIIDYSPVGVINTIIEGNNLKKSIERGDFTAQQQHKFVQDLGKATAGTMLYILGYALAKAGITTGESDDDKDVANFMKNTLGTSQYSIKVGNKSYTYDWAQPISAPFAMMANLVGKKNENKNILNNVLDTLDVPMNLLLEQSFMSSIKNVFSNSDGLADGIFQEISSLPSRAIPTLFKQIADMIDTTQRSTFEKGKPIETAVNQVKSKIPGLSHTLAPVSNTLGDDVKKYGGETNPFLYAFNVFANPSNVNSENVNRAGSEIYKVYKQTGDKSIFPKQTGYSQIIDGKNITLTSNEKYQFQKTSGKYISDVVNDILNSKTYKTLNDYNKSKILKEIVSDSNEKAKEELARNKNLKYEKNITDINIEDLTKKGLDYSNAYIFKSLLKDISSDKDTDGKAINCSVTSKKAKYIMDMNTNDSQKDMLLTLINDSDTKITTKELKKLNGNYLTYLQQSGNKNKDGISKKDEYMTFVDSGIKIEELNKYYNNIGKIEGIKGENEKTISGSKKNAVASYINSLNITANEKMLLFAKQGYGGNYREQIHSYINSLNIPKEVKYNIWESIYN